MKCPKENNSDCTTQIIAAAESTWKFFIDETVLRESGITDFIEYAVDPTTDLAPDLFITL